MNIIMCIISILASQGVLRFVEAFCDLKLWASCLIAAVSVILIQIGLLAWKEKR